MSSARNLRSFSALSFDCYGTLVDWETGVYNALKPLCSRLDTSHPLKEDRISLLNRYSYHSSRIQEREPTLLYDLLLGKVYIELAKELDLIDQISNEEATHFGESISTWPTHPDTIDALHRLKKHYKLVILSNVDKASFNKTLAGQLAGVDFDAVYVAEEIGTYKPDLRNFEYLVDHVKADLGIEKDKLLHTAYALFHDMVPATKIGLATCWIERLPNAIGHGYLRSELDLDFQFKTLGEMADDAGV
ncbi:hypothetical protein FQN57_005996 [Myotisia sp. PD_48]|nr:hypothetical protein FQN57_005996 [Myotisia sp. PD_48]